MCAKSIKKSSETRLKQSQKPKTVIVKKETLLPDEKPKDENREEVIEGEGLLSQPKTEDITDEKAPKTDAEEESLVDDKNSDHEEDIEDEALEATENQMDNHSEEPVAVTKEQVEEEIPTAPGKPRHKMTPWLWWLSAVLATAVLFVSGVVLANGFYPDKNSEPNSDESTEPETPPEQETPPGEDSASEPEPEPEPEKPAEKQPVAPDPPKAEPLQSIAPRPEPSGQDVASGEKLVALTFDDGPSPYTTPRLLDILQGRGVKVTFFVLGTMAQRSPDILRREANEGHEVASHTPYHNQLTYLSASQIRAEAVEMDRIFTEILGTRPPFTRPPYGAFNNVVGEALGQPMVLWSVDPRDWQDRNAATVCSRVTSAARNGSIILVHDIHATTVDAVPCIVDTLRSWGYEFVTVSELAAARGIKMANGVAYYSF